MPTDTKKQPKVSIVVPIYNVEKYLAECIDSIIGQTLTDIEIILVNDGSTDHSLEICNEYARKDPRIVVIDKPNEGYGKTMNRGLDAATGQYVGIIESDDWIDPDMFETLYELAEKNDCDMVKSNFYDFIDGVSTVNENLPKHLIDQVICARDNNNKEANVFFAQPAIWSAIYKRSFLNDKKIRFLESPGASYQDTGFNFKCWAMASRIYLTNRAFLHYRQHANQSIVSTGKVFCVCDEWAEVDRFMNDYPEWKNASAKLRNQIKLGSYMWNLERLAGPEKEQFRKRFATEFNQALEKQEIAEDCFRCKKEYIKFRQVIAPRNVWLRFYRHWLNIRGLFIRTRVKNGTKYWCILAGLIPVWSRENAVNPEVSFMGCLLPKTQSGSNA